MGEFHIPDLRLLARTLDWVEEKKKKGCAQAGAGVEANK